MGRAFLPYSAENCLWHTTCPLVCPPTTATMPGGGLFYLHREGKRETPRKRLCSRCLPKEQFCCQGKTLAGVPESVRSDQDNRHLLHIRNDSLVYSDSGQFRCPGPWPVGILTLLPFLALSPLTTILLPGECPLLPPVLHVQRPECFQEVNRTLLSLEAACTNPNELESGYLGLKCRQNPSVTVPFTNDA